MIQVLFIGNSYTYFHDMPTEIFAPLAQADGETVLVSSVTRGGVQLMQFTDPDGDLGKKLADAVRGRTFDWVVLQEQSVTPFREEETFRTGLGILKAMLAPQTKHFLLYATWGRRPDHEFLQETGLSCEEMTRLLADAYDRAGAELGMEVAHAGKAFLQYRRDHPGAELYHKDGTHPSPLGSRIAAETIWNTVKTARR